MSAYSIRAHVFALSNLYRRASPDGDFPTECLAPAQDPELVARGAAVAAARGDPAHLVFGPRLELGRRLLFPSFLSGEESPLQETRRLLHRIAKRVGWMGHGSEEMVRRVYSHLSTSSGWAISSSGSGLT
jgi:hypothetical protein